MIYILWIYTYHVYQRGDMLCATYYGYMIYKYLWIYDIDIIISWIYDIHIIILWIYDIHVYQRGGAITYTCKYIIYPQYVYHDTLVMDI